MVVNSRYARAFPWVLACLVLMARPVHAVQVHAAPEGLYAHQLSHVFFAFSMALLVYWLRQRQLVKQPGWRLIQYAAILFVLWNLDSMLAHYLDGRSNLYAKIDEASLHGRITLLKGPEALVLLYYLSRMDHLLSVPAMALLFLGLRLLLRDQPISPRQGSDP